MNMPCDTSDLLVFSNLRWDIIFQRPQHLLSRYAKYRRVFYFEEPILGMTDLPRIHLKDTVEGVQVVVPYLPSSIKSEDIEPALKDLVDDLIFDENIQNYSMWFYSPRAWSFTQHLEPHRVIFDVNQLELTESSNPKHIELENELMKKTDLVVTGTQYLFETKVENHPNVHTVCNGIDYAHFSQGRLQLIEPDDQINIPHPRIGFQGNIDENFDLELLDKMASLQPEYQFILVGSTDGIDSSLLPQRPNIHYLGKKDYYTLLLYLSGWDCAMIPAKLGKNGCHASPLKTPEYLAAGKPVVATALKDIIHPYAKEKLVQVAFSPEDFLLCIDRAITERLTDPDWLDRVDSFLAEATWDQAFKRIAQLELQLDRDTEGKMPFRNDIFQSLSAG